MGPGRGVSKNVYYPCAAAATAAAAEQDTGNLGFVNSEVSVNEIRWLKNGTSSIFALS